MGAFSRLNGESVVAGISVVMATAVNAREKAIATGKLIVDYRCTKKRETRRGHKQVMEMD